MPILIISCLISINMAQAFYHKSLSANYQQNGDPGGVTVQEFCVYLWIKALHIMAVVTWFAGLFYLPRLFVYHAMSDDQISRERFKIMERKLYRGIMTPSMVAVIALGAWLLYLSPQWLSMGWMHIKLLLVVLLVAYHHVCLIYLKQLAGNRCRRSHVFFRWFNEMPVIALLIIVLLAVLKPF